MSIVDTAGNALVTPFTGQTYTVNAAATPLQFMLGNFEQPNIFVVDPTQTLEGSKYLWGLYTAFSPPNTAATTTVLQTAEKVQGLKGLQNTFDSHQFAFACPSTTYSGGQCRNWQFHFFPAIFSKPGWTDGYRFAAELVVNGTGEPGSDAANYIISRMNRMEVWIKVPASTVPAPNTGFNNFNFATFQKEVNAPIFDAESNNWHFYMDFNLYPHSGTVWQKLIIDTKPQAQRGHSGNEEFPDYYHNLSALTPNYTFFDLMTRFYLDFWLPGDPGGAAYDFGVGSHTVFLDKILFYEENPGEVIDQVSSLRACYDPGINEFDIGWNRRIDNEATLFDLRYSFTGSFHTNGWLTGSPLPAGTGPGGVSFSSGTGVVAFPDSGVRTVMEYKTSGVVIGANTQVWLGVRPQGASTFRVISLPLPTP